MLAHGGVVLRLVIVVAPCAGISNDGIIVICSPALVVLPHSSLCSPIRHSCSQPSFMHSSPLSCSPIHCLCSHYLLFVRPHLLLICARLCLFNLMWPWFQSAHLPLFAPADAVPAAVATAHMCTLTLTLGSCVPTLCVALLFVAPYL